MRRTLIFLFVGPVFGELVSWGDPLCKPESTAAVEFPNLRDVVSIASTTFDEDDYRDGNIYDSPNYLPGTINSFSLKKEKN